MVSSLRASTVETSVCRAMGALRGGRSEGRSKSAGRSYRLPGPVGILQELATGARITLGPRCLLGRHAACDMSRPDPRLSGEHAVVRWVDDRWEVRDLGSRNGTFLTGRRLAPGER